MRRIVVMIDSLVAEGAERVAVELARGIDRSRFQAHVVVTRHTGPLEQLLREAGISVTVLGRQRRSSVLPLLRALPLIRRADLVHTHMFGSNAWGSLLALIARRPLVAHEHNIVGKISMTRRLAHRWLIGRVARRFVCVSQTGIDQIASCGVPRSKLQLISNGVDIATSLPAAQAQAALGVAGNVVGIVAALRPEKQHELLLQAFAQLLATGRTATLCIVGDGPQLQYLRALAQQLEIDDRIVWTGQRTDAPRLASAFDVSVLCSRSEGLPLSALEAMGAGVPMVATAVGGLVELLSDGAGVLVPPGDAEQLSDAIGRLLDDAQLRRSIGTAGRLRVAATYDNAAAIRAVEAIYDDVTAALPEQRYRQAA